MTDETNDEGLDRLLAPLRDAKPTDAMRRANRRAALDATRVTPWWKQSIRIPVPVALATAAGLAAVVVWSGFTTETAENTPQPLPAVVPSAGPTSSSLVASAGTRQNGLIEDSASYVPGMGYVDRVTRHYPED